ncbi:MAG: endonuclease/exonuclease/phosphatase family protein [Paracoccaceae bacterium]
MGKILLSCASWNIHRAKGADDQVAPSRVVDAIESGITPHRPDVLALQEADGDCPPHARIVDVEKIAQITGLDYIHTTADLRWGPDSDGFLGTILFLHPRLKRMHADVIDLPGHCHRGAVAVEIEMDGRMFRIMSAHLSLSQPLRIVQMRIVGQYLFRRPKMQTIFIGDFNEWRPWGGMMFTKRIVGTSFRGPAKATFPTRFPLLPLDRVLTDGDGRIESMSVLNLPETNLASDHRPILGKVTVA